MSSRRTTRAMTGEELRRARRRAFLAGAVLAPLVLSSGAAFAQAQPLALGEGAPVDEDAGIRVPEGFDAQVFADGVGRARHLAVRDNGDVYVALRAANRGRRHRGAAR